MLLKLDPLKRIIEIISPEDIIAIIETMIMIFALCSI